LPDDVLVRAMFDVSVFWKMNSASK